MSEPHWYLLFLGVRPKLQGKGHGTLLVNELLKLTENTNWPYWVDTQKEEMYGFFKNLALKWAK